MNNKYKLETFLEKESYNKFLGTIIDTCNNKHTTKIYVKFSPLVDPIKYMLGKYDTSYNILELPKHLEETNETFMIQIIQHILMGFFLFYQVTY